MMSALAYYPRAFHVAGIAFLYPDRGIQHMGRCILWADSR